METLQIEFMKLIFFAQQMTYVQVVLERDGFRLSNPQTHTHLKYNCTDLKWMKEEVQNLKDFILMAHEYNENRIHIVTHEELKAKNSSSAEFICSGGGDKAVYSKAQRDEYLTFINSLK